MVGPRSTRGISTSGTRLWSPGLQLQHDLVNRCKELEALSTDEGCNLSQLVGELTKSTTETIPDVTKYVIMLNKHLVYFRFRKRHPGSGSPKSYPRLDRLEHARNRLSLSVSGLEQGVRDWNTSGYPGEASEKILTDYAQAALVELKRLRQSHSRFLERALKAGKDEVLVFYWLTEALHGDGYKPKPIPGFFHHLLAIGTRKGSDDILGYRWDSITPDNHIGPNLKSNIQVMALPKREARVVTPISIMLKSDVEAAFAACGGLTGVPQKCRHLAFAWLVVMSKKGCLLNHNAALLAYAYLAERHQTHPGYHHYRWDPAWFEQKLKEAESANKGVSSSSKGQAATGIATSV
jgi:hypothetical protein